ncbi:uncharacterized protein LOC128746596 [Synchiropus splendidus]|uniref:uncharacterized protein LOC128746596 n=1 Tax=Synchiropus splendidus TaxID=270530 RepID=UPI00237D3E05|nr:uncharacterized protein LOC128746596 [Synchiropus splendidus]
MLGRLTSLVLLPLIAAGLEISSPCDAPVCFHTWKLHNSYVVGIVRNGRILRTKDEEGCTVRVENLNDTAGQHRCGQAEDGLPAESAVTEAPVLKVAPRKPVSLQCILLSSIGDRRCPSHVAFFWVDETREQIGSDTTHGRVSSPCNASVTVTLPGVESRTFRCVAKVGQNREMSVKLRVKVPELSGRRGPAVPQGDGEETGSSRAWVSTVVGLLLCVALTAVVALLVARRRRIKKLPGTSTSKSSVNEEGGDSAEEVIYAEVVLPDVSSRLTFLDLDATEYACVRYK